MDIEPDDAMEVIEERTKWHGEQNLEWLKSVWERGLAIYGRAKPQERLQWYLDQTLPRDLGYALDTDYMDKREAGVVGPFHVEVLFEQYKKDAELVLAAKQEAEAAGMPLPPDALPHLQPPPMMWVQLIGMRKEFMGWVQSEFRQLLNEEAKREGLDISQVLSRMLAGAA